MPLIHAVITIPEASGAQNAAAAVKSRKIVTFDRDISRAQDFSFSCTSILSIRIQPRN